MQMNDIRYYYDSFFSDRTKEQFEEVILVISRITDKLNELNCYKEIVAIYDRDKEEYNTPEYDKATKEVLVIYKKQITEIKEYIDGEVNQLKHLKKHLPFRIDYSTYKEMKEEMDYPTSMKDKIINKVLLSDLRTNINVTKQLEKIVDIIIEKKSNCDENYDVSTYLFAFSLVENILLELYKFACFKKMPHHNRIYMLLDVITIFNHYFESGTMNLDDLNEYLSSRYINDYNKFLLTGFVLAYAEKENLNMKVEDSGRTLKKQTCKKD